MRLRVLRVVAGAILPLGAVLSGTVGAVSAAEPLPASMEGERLFAQSYVRATYDRPGEVTIAGECGAARVGDTYTFTYRAEGPATGPYPGTYTETGTVTVEVDHFSGGSLYVLSSGPITSWEATFEIDSPLARVSGTKTLSAVQSSPSSGWGRGSCYEQGIQSSKNAQAVLDYEATIRPTTGGVFTDQGSANGWIQYQGEQRCDNFFCPRPGTFDLHHFSEDFITSTGVVAVLPADKAACKDGGYEDFGLDKKECNDAVKEQKKATP